MDDCDIIIYTLCGASVSPIHLRNEFFVVVWKRALITKLDCSQIVLFFLFSAGRYDY